ncbi:DUF3616 domain-containing protein [Methylobacterium oryzisoli]|uniref:DUF3616 domain-containing protein n=1 Tax=Methylobacterium oryzisoli TaxID=3385502 RepID=UPI00389216D5
MTRLRTLVSALALCLPGSVAWSQTKAGPVLVHWGLCEASAAVPYPAGSFGDRFLVVNDDDNVLRLYRSEESGAFLPLKDADLDAALGTGKAQGANQGKTPKADFEGAAWLGDEIVLIGSHSRNEDGELREGRGVVAGLTIAGPSDALAVKPKGKSFRGLTKAMADLDPRLAERIALDTPTKKGLSPKRRGFNIEGLAAAPDGRTLLIGLRSPLTPDNDAMVVPFENPAEVLASGAAPRLGKPITLDLKGRGIRDIAYAPGARTYFIIAGGSGGGGESADLYRWSGEASSAPVRVPGAAEALAAIPDFQPEGLLVAPDGSKVRVLSDDGEACGDAKPEKFRSVLLTLGPSS